MKTCPRCQKTYADDNLNFCLEDGSVLVMAHEQTMMPETVIMNDPRPTQPQPPPATQAGPPPNWQQQPQYQPQPYSLQQPQKSSKTWLWVVGILGVLVLLCGGGFVGFVFWAASQAEKNANSILNGEKFASPTPSNKKTSTSTTSTTAAPANTSSTTLSSSDRTDVTTVDLDMFVQKYSVFGTTEMNGDELIMGSLQKNFYYALAAPSDYTTEDADTCVTLRNINDATSSLGYGLIFHSNPQPLQQDYAFLIDTKRKKYKIVHHEPQKELVVKNWTASTAINGGTEENTLEVRDQTDKIELYINGNLVTSITNIYGYSGGVVGLYSGDAVKIAFKKLEIRR